MLCFCRIGLALGQLQSKNSTIESGSMRKQKHWFSHEPTNVDKNTILFAK